MELFAFKERGLDRCSDDGQLFFECVNVRGGGAASFEGRDAGSREDSMMASLVDIAPWRLLPVG